MSLCYNTYMPQKFYLTTPLYYVNDVPHIGHAYTTIAADVLARYKRMLGFDVHFLTGTDEHGQKIALAAEEQKRTPKEHVDLMVERFRTAWERLNIYSNDFIRTTEERHVKVVQQIFKKLKDKGDLYKGEYEGWYCTPCETFWSDLHLVEKEGKKCCPDCGRETKKIKEETYFFRLSKYKDSILDYININDGFIRPTKRKNEMVNFINQGLKDLSVTRTTFKWGVPLADDLSHVVYVWFDALINYISALGYPDGKNFKKYWPAEVHLMGKEIVRFHAIIWPAILMALDLDLPKLVFGHGWWTVEGKKMSKSKGNVVDPLVLAKEYGVDPVRYFLMREVPFGADGDFSMKSFTNRYNADLANDIGNLLNRTLTMVEKYFKGQIPKVGNPKIDDLSKELVESAGEAPQTVDKHMNGLAFSDALAAIWKLVNKANTYIEKESPWKISKAGETEKLAAVMCNLCEVLKVSAVLVSPFMPDAAEKMWNQLGLKLPLSLDSKLAGVKVAKGNPLFPRLEK